MWVLKSWRLPLSMGQGRFILLCSQCINPVTPESYLQHVESLNAQHPLCAKPSARVYGTGQAADGEIRCDSCCRRHRAPELLPACSAGNDGARGTSRRPSAASCPFRAMPTRRPSAISLTTALRAARAIATAGSKRHTRPPSVPARPANPWRAIGVVTCGVLHSRKKVLANTLHAQVT